MAQASAVPEGDEIASVYHHQFGIGHATASAVRGCPSSKAISPNGSGLF
jgi:hypothetical protein